MSDEGLRQLERRWAEGNGEIESGEAYLRALERVAADLPIRQRVHGQVVAAHLARAGIALPLVPLPEVDPFALRGVVHGSRAIETWRALRAITGATGAYPLIVDRDLSRTLDHIGACDDDPATILERAARLGAPSPATWKRERQRALLARLTEERSPTSSEWRSVLTEIIARPEPAVPEDAGEWPANLGPLRAFSIHASHRRDPTTGRFRFEPLDEVHLVLLPTRAPWHAAAFLRWGDGNDSPPAHEHVALHRSWFERQGAEPVGLAGDVLEMHVERPVLDRAEAIALARQQLSYCSSVIERPRETIASLAARLLGAPVWHFWWD